MLRLPKSSLIAVTACVPVLGLAVAFSPAAGASTAASHPTPSARAAAIALAALKHLKVGEHATDHRVSGHELRVKGLTQQQSTNWSGYADTGSAGTFTSVTAGWTEPSVSCGLQTSLAAFWVGIDGDGSNSVEQDGTLAECYLDHAYYYSWWEMYPTNSVQEVGSTVAPGDSISASVVRTGTSYALKVTDSTHPANSFSTTQTCSTCTDSTAEWIAEAPSSNTGVEPLANFHSWTATGATVNSGVISSFSDNEITMVDTLGRTKAQPGPLNSAGNGFTVTWVRSS